MKLHSTIYPPKRILTTKVHIGISGNPIVSGSLIYFKMLNYAPSTFFVTYSTVSGSGLNGKSMRRGNFRVKVLGSANRDCCKHAPAKPIQYLDLNQGYDLLKFGFGGLGFRVYRVSGLGYTWTPNNLLFEGPLI